MYFKICLLATLLLTLVSVRAGASDYETRQTVLLDMYSAFNTIAALPGSLSEFASCIDNYNEWLTTKKSTPSKRRDSGQSHSLFATANEIERWKDESVSLQLEFFTSRSISICLTKWLLVLEIQRAPISPLLLAYENAWNSWGSGSADFDRLDFKIFLATRPEDFWRNASAKMNITRWKEHQGTQGEPYDPFLDANIWRQCYNDQGDMDSCSQSDMRLDRAQRESLFRSALGVVESALEYSLVPLVNSESYEDAIVTLLESEETPVFRALDGEVNTFVSNLGCTPNSDEVSQLLRSDTEDISHEMLEPLLRTEKFCLNKNNRIQVGTAFDYSELSTCQIEGTSCLPHEYYDFITDEADGEASIGDL